MRMRFTGLQQVHLDPENDKHNPIPGRTETILDAVQKVKGHSRDTTEAKQQREYLSKSFNSAAGSVLWQERMILFYFPHIAFPIKNTDWLKNINFAS